MKNIMNDLEKTSPPQLPNQVSELKNYIDTLSEDGRFVISDFHCKNVNNQIPGVKAEEVEKILRENFGDKALEGAGKFLNVLSDALQKPDIWHFSEDPKFNRFYTDIFKSDNRFYLITLGPAIQDQIFIYGLDDNNTPIEPDNFIKQLQQAINESIRKKNFDPGSLNRLAAGTINPFTNFLNISFLGSQPGPFQRYIGKHQISQEEVLFGQEKAIPQFKDSTKVTFWYQFPQ